MHSFLPKPTRHLILYPLDMAMQTWLWTRFKISWLMLLFVWLTKVWLDCKNRDIAVRSKSKVYETIFLQVYSSRISRKWFAPGIILDMELICVLHFCRQISFCTIQLCVEYIYFWELFIQYIYRVFWVKPSSLVVPE